MPLLPDCLAAAGTLTVAIGSGLQAASELRRYGSVARRLGLVEAAEAAAEMFRTQMRLTWSFFLPWSLWPGFTWSIWRLPANIKSFVAANKRYFNATQAISSAQLTDDEKVESTELSRKSMYWSLIMLGTLVVFAGAIVGIVLDLHRYGLAWRLLCFAVEGPAKLRESSGS
jgi:hypothetical protein